MAPMDSEAGDELSRQLADGELAEDQLRQLFQYAPEQGFTTVFRTYHPVLCQHAFRFVHDAEVARDLVADVFTHFWQQQTYQTVTTSYRAYLFRAVRFKAISYLRHQQVQQQFLLVRPDNSFSDSTEQLLYEQDLLVYVEKTLQQLPPRCRQVFVLSRFDGKTYAEIAAELRISVKGVEAHISKALLFFRLALRDEFLLVVLIAEKIFLFGVG